MWLNQSFHDDARLHDGEKGLALPPHFIMLNHGHDLDCDLVMCKPLSKSSPILANHDPYDGHTMAKRTKSSGIRIPSCRWMRSILPGVGGAALAHGL